MSKDKSTITIEVIINASIEKVWECWTNIEHIVNWYYASDDWHAPYAENDLRAGGRFKTTMSAKDGSMSFDFEGTYTTVKSFEHIEYTIDDGRKVVISFSNSDTRVEIVQTFEAESENSLELQRNGWQAILNNFKAYTERQ